MAEAPPTPDDERDRLAREDEERELRSQADERDRPAEADTDRPAEGGDEVHHGLVLDEPVTADPPAETAEPPAETAAPPATDAALTDTTASPTFVETGTVDTGTVERDEPPALVEPTPIADRDESERRAQADDERPTDIADDPGYDALPASEHVAHGEPGTDIVDQPGEPDVPEQEEYVPTVVMPAVAPEASDTVFVEPPVEPRPRHNRLFGVGMVLLSTIVFAALYAGLAALLLGFRLIPDEFLAGFELFLRRPAYIVPIVAYAVFAILAALLVNRARWWAYALLSLVVGLLVYAASVAVVLLLAGYLAQDAEAQRRMLVDALTQPVLIAAGFAARETLLWFGLAVSARGRRVVARNRSEREAYESRVARSEAVWDGGAA